MIKIFLTLSCLSFFLGAQCSAQGVTKRNADNIDAGSTSLDLSKLKIEKLPRPNSGTFSFEEAGKRKDEIYNMEPTNKYWDWKSPTSGGALHINQKDEIEVYRFTFGIPTQITDTGITFMKAPKDTSVIVKNDELRHYVGGFGDGNEASVLITSEISLHKSEAMKKIMLELWEPGIQLYYLVRKE